MNTQAIDNTTSIEEALDITGKLTTNELLTADAVRKEYIKAKRGYRAVSGFFNPTRANIRTKFTKVWKEEHAK